MTIRIDPNAEFIESARRLRERATERHTFGDVGVDVDQAARRDRSLRTCHRFRAEGPPATWRANNGYVPELAAGIEDNPNLTDGARRCARKIAELTYRQNREGRTLPVTITYLAKALGRCSRTVQRYLRQLEDCGYVAVDVLLSKQTRLCVGLMVRLLAPAFARHHKERWPGALGNPGVTSKSWNQRLWFKRAEETTPIPVLAWAARSMSGVFDAFMKTRPLAGQPVIDFRQ